MTTESKAAPESEASAAPPADTPAADNVPEAEPAEKPPFALAARQRVRYGARRGKVEVVRGGGVVPYDVRIRWDDQKYPEWFLYSNLQTLYEQGAFEPDRA